MSQSHDHTLSEVFSSRPRLSVASPRAEPLDLANFPAADAGASDADNGAACRKLCDDQCLPNAHDDSRRGIAFWNVRESCAQAGGRP